MDVPVDSQDAQGRTALIHYAAAGNEDQVMHLLSKGAKLYHQDADKCAPFYHACAHGHYNLVKRLLDTSDVDPNGDSDAKKGYCFSMNIPRAMVGELMILRSYEKSLANYTKYAEL